MVRNSFCCNAIERFLGKDSTELEISEPIPPKPIREDMKCLICGDEMNVYYIDKLPWTEEACKYGAHEACAAILFKINNKPLLANNFRCCHVTYYLKPEEVSGLITGGSAKLDSIRIILKARGIVKHTSYTPKRVRYENPDIRCERCGDVVGINEEDHDLAYCSARCAGTPVPTRDYEYILSRVKRVRRIALNDYKP